MAFVPGPPPDDPAKSGWAAGVSGVGFTAGPTAAPSSTDDGVLTHLELIEPLGSGGMGEVWRARDHRLQRDVAAKVLREGQAAAPFLAEAVAQAALAHPGIVPVYERGVLADGRPVFTMAINAGRTLHDVIVDAARRAGTRHAATRHRRGCAGSRRSWPSPTRKGVLHRDLKPANIMVGDVRRGSGAGLGARRGTR